MANAWENDAEYTPQGNAWENDVEYNPSSRISKPAKGEVERDLKNFYGGITGISRGALNLVNEAFNAATSRSNNLSVQPKQPASNKELLGDKLLLPVGTDKTSGAYQTGALLDPAALSIAGGVAKVAPYAPVLGSGLLSGIKAVGKNMLSGGITGGAIGGLADTPDRVSSIGVGALTGAGANVAIPALLKSGAYLGGKGVDLVTGQMPKVNAGKMARDVAGSNLDQIKRANSIAPDTITAGQVAEPIDNDIYST